MYHKNKIQTTSIELRLDYVSRQRRRRYCCFVIYTYFINFFSLHIHIHLIQSFFLPLRYRPSANDQPIDQSINPISVPSNLPIAPPGKEERKKKEAICRQVQLKNLLAFCLSLSLSVSHSIQSLMIRACLVSVLSVSLPFFTRHRHPQQYPPCWCLRQRLDLHPRPRRYHQEHRVS